MEVAAKLAGFSVRFCPVKRPRYRAIVERAIKTINDQICRNLPGRVLSLRDARRWGYDAEEQAVVMLDELEAFSNQVIANYNVEPHEGIGWRQPAMMFARDIDSEGVMNFTDFESFRRDTLEIVQKAQLSPSGIRAFGALRYHDIDAVLELLNDLACLEPRRSMRDDATATVNFRYDPMDISRIYVWNRVTRKYVVLKCSDERYADGMPLFLHEKIAKEARDQSQAFNTEEQRLLARGRTIQAVRECIHPGAKAESRKRLGELLEISRIRSITGNLVHLLDTDLPQSSLSDFIGTDRAALTCVDQEILSSRPTPKPATKNKDLRARRLAEERREEGEAEISLPSESGRTFAKKGGYQ